MSELNDWLAKWIEAGKRWHEHMMEMSDIGYELRKGWLDITYPSILYGRIATWLWGRLICPFGIHLFDECQSLESHSLVCDACDLDIEIIGQWVKVKDVD